MTDTKVRYTVQRGTDTQITQIEVDRAWADSVGAADWYERCQLWKGGGGVDNRFVAEAKRRMLEATDYAERLQDAYNEQQDEVEGKRVMMTSVNGKVKVDPAWCEHTNVVDIDPDMDSEPYAECLDCGAVLDGNREWVTK